MIEKQEYSGLFALQTKRYTLFAVIALCYGVLLVYAGYFLERHDTMYLLSSFGALFVLYLLSCKLAEQYSIAFWLCLAVFLRLLLLLLIPNLSDDFYRFIWDGRLLIEGIHPFAHIPSWYISEAAPDVPGITASLFEKLNSPQYFTIYPPINQGVFALAAYGGADVKVSVVLMRTFIILAETGSIFLLYKILKQYQKPVKHLLLYALNPLVIIELSGNLHFEALAIFFLLLSLYYLKKLKENEDGSVLIKAALSFAGAIATKLLPAIFLPLLLRRLPLRQCFLFYMICGVATLLLFLPLLSPDLVGGFQDSISLYYQKFEFNASLYYLIREVGFWVKGYNVIEQAGLWMAFLAFVAIMIFCLNKNVQQMPLPEAFMWVYCIFLFCSLTLHPWYLTPLVALSVFTNYRFAITWSGLIFLTYAGYSAHGFSENMLIVALEYGITLAILAFELGRKRFGLTKFKFFNTKTINI